MRKMLIASLACAALMAVATAPVAADTPVAPREPVHALPGALPRPFNFGPRLPLAHFTVQTEIDYAGKSVDITVPVESIAYGALGWKGRVSLFIDDVKIGEDILYPGIGVIFRTNAELDQETHEACVRLVSVIDPQGPDILPENVPMQCKEFNHFGRLPQPNTLGR